MNRDHKELAFLAWVLVCLVWGTTYLGIRIALETLPPMLMAGFRWLAAGGLLIGFLKIRNQALPHSRDWPALALQGALMMGIGNGGVVWAQQTIPSGLTAVLVAAVPFWMVGIERVVYGGDRLTVRRILGLAIGFAGIVLLVGPEIDGGANRSFLAGVAAAQFACFGWALGSSISRHRKSADNVVAAAALQMFFAGVALALVGTALGEWPRVAFNGRSAGALAYLVVAGSMVGYSAFAYALKHLPVALVSLYAYINPVIAVVLGTLLIGEPFDPRVIVAAGVVFAGSAMVKSS